MAVPPKLLSAILPESDKYLLFCIALMSKYNMLRSNVWISVLYWVNSTRIRYCVVPRIRDVNWKPVAFCGKPFSNNYDIRFMPFKYTDSLMF